MLFRSVLEPLQLAHGLRQHRRVELGVDDRVTPFVFNDQRWAKAVVPETATALPVDSLGDAARVFAVNDLFHARDDVSMAVFTKFHHDPAASHLVSNRARGAGTGEGIEDEIFGVSGKGKYALD